MPNPQQEMVSELKRINRNLEALTKAVKSLKSENVYNIYTAGSDDPIRIYSADFEGDHDFTQEDVVKHHPDYEQHRTP